MGDKGFARLKNLMTLHKRERPPVGATPADVVHRENKLRLLRYRHRPQGLAHQTPVLMVPSLINRHYVLDLTPGKSFAEFLVAAGHDVWVIDWGTPADEDRYVDFEELCDVYLARCVRIAARSGPRGKVHLLGYCMGGIFTAIHAARDPERVASLCNLAAPMRFRGDGMLGVWTRSAAFDVRAVTTAFGVVPWQLLQSSFLMLRPTLNLAKAVNLIDRAWNDRFLDGFLALETWANDNVGLPGTFFRRYLDELYRRDALMQGELVIGGRAVRLQRVRCPVLAVVFEHDTIAPWQDCACIEDAIGSVDKAVWKLPGSHVGGVVSRAAAQGLWPALSTWWEQRDSDPAHQ